MCGSDQQTGLSTLLETVAKACAGSAPCTGAFSGVMLDTAEPVLSEFVRSMLLWESTTPKAAAAVRRIESRVVDFNELRVCLAGELLEILGERYPRGPERAQRLRAALNDVFTRAHSVTLEHLTGMGKREAWSYLDSLEGVPPFVSSRVVLLALGGHAAPVDGRILSCLAAAGAVEEGASEESVAGVLERRVRAGEMIPTYLRLQEMADEGPPFTEAARAVGGKSGRGGAGRGRAGGTKAGRNGAPGRAGARRAGEDRD